MNEMETLEGIRVATEDSIKKLSALRDQGCNVDHALSCFKQALHWISVRIADVRSAATQS